jgi:hypothetical protein
MTDISTAVGKIYFFMLILIFIKGLVVGSNCNLIKYTLDQKYRTAYNKWLEAMPK